MNKEKLFLKELSKKDNSKISFEQIAKKIEYNKYHKTKKSSNVFAFYLLIIMAVLVISTITIVSSISTKVNDKNIYQEYSGFIKQEFEQNNDEDMGPLPHYTIENVLLDVTYLYEVEIVPTENEMFVGVYIETKTAEQIYEKNKIVDDAEVASPIAKVDGSIVNWFYQREYYQKDKVKWYQFGSENFIPTEINGFHCCGVYKTQSRIIKKEIITNTNVNYLDETFHVLEFKGENSFLTPISVDVPNVSKWYISYEQLTTDNYHRLFRKDYNLELDCTIVNNTITIKTFAVFKEEELAKIEDKKIIDFYRSTNKYILNQDTSDDDLKYGYERSYQYSYDEYVKEIINYFKN